MLFLLLFTRVNSKKQGYFIVKNHKIPLFIFMHIVVKTLHRIILVVYILKHLQQYYSLLAYIIVCLKSLQILLYKSPHHQTRINRQHSRGVSFLILKQCSPSSETSTVALDVVLPQLVV